MGEANAVEVRDNPEEKRYEAWLDGELAGFAAYIPADGMLVLPHTEVGDAHEGKGVGSALARHALDDIRARGLRVMPTCPFIASWMRRHPDYLDLAFNAPASRVSD
ncbi:GNAT family N-acetyltransferase [Nocardioides sp. CPCC 205120]|uniref:GNAT family N-acetyltransferase n=1 Tax=Nocardioides sp. CPCC 205120 TaxID=3406462 RepID=UPI003B5154CA